MDKHELREHFTYDHKTGDLIWKDNPARSLAWRRKHDFKIAGSTKGRVGYRDIRLFDKTYRASRIVWIMHHGDIPFGMEVDHRNNDGLDNRIENLRLATRAQNAANRRCYNAVGLKGVSKRVRKDGTVSYIAGITTNGKRTVLGRFDCPHKAHAAYCAEALVRYGEFARFH